MANRFQKLLYYLSAEAPILLIFAITWFIEKSSWTRPFIISWKVPLFLTTVSVLLIALFINSFDYACKNLQKISINCKSFTSGDGWIVAYITSYLLPLSSLQFGKRVWLVLSLILVILLIALSFTDYVTPHPVLYLKRFHFYVINVEEAADGYYLITKKKIHKASDVKKVSQLFEFLLIQKE